MLFLKNNPAERSKKKVGQSLVEYIALITFILFTFLTFQKYIAQGLAGRWKTVGDTFGEGRIYEPNVTVDCMFDIYQNTNTWFRANCFEEHCYDDCLMLSKNPTDCRDCILFCAARSPRCN